MASRRSMLLIRFVGTCNYRQTIANLVTCHILSQCMDAPFSSLLLLPKSHFPDVDEAELKQMDSKITELQEKLKARQTECRSLESRKFQS